MKNNSAKAYFDHASTSPARDCAVKAMHEFHQLKYGNPLSKHLFGQEASIALEQARSRVAGCLNVDCKEIVFTSGATESIIISLIGAAIANRHRGNHIITTSFEHHATHAVCKFLKEEMGFEIDIIGIDHDGRIRLDELESKLRDDTILVSAMAVNNEIGTIQDIRRIVELCGTRRIAVQSDYVQAIGKIHVDLKRDNVDLAVGSGHKFGGPKGTGWLYIKQGTQIRPLIPGSHEFGIRAGTVNVSGVVGMSYAMEEAVSEVEEVSRRLGEYKMDLYSFIKENAPDAEVNGSLTCSVNAILNIRLPGCAGEKLVELFNREGVAISTASACQSGQEEPSHVLRALGIDYLDALSSIRISMGYTTVMEEVEHFKRVFPKVYKRAKE